MARKKIGEMLIEAGVLTESGLRSALNEQKRWGGTLGRTVVEMKLVNETELVRVLAQQLNLPTVDLESKDIPLPVLDLIPVEVAQQHSIVPFAQQMKFLDVAMSDPTNIGIIDELTIRTKLNIRPFLAGPKMIERAIGKFYGKGFAGTTHRPELALPIDSGDLVLDGPGGRAAPELVVEQREGIRPYPRAGGTTNAPPVARPAGEGRSTGTTRAPPMSLRDAEVYALQDRLSALEALVARDEEVLRKLLALLVEKQVATREEILERIS